MFRVLSVVVLAAILAASGRGDGDAKDGSGVGPNPPPYRIGILLNDFGFGGVPDGQPMIYPDWNADGILGYRVWGWVTLPEPTPGVRNWWRVIPGQPTRSDGETPSAWNNAQGFGPIAYLGAGTLHWSMFVQSSWGRGDDFTVNLPPGVYAAPFELQIGLSPLGFPDLVIWQGAAQTTGYFGF